MHSVAKAKNGGNEGGAQQKTAPDRKHLHVYLISVWDAGYPRPTRMAVLSGRSVMPVCQNNTNYLLLEV